MGLGLKQSHAGWHKGSSEQVWACSLKGKDWECFLKWTVIKRLVLNMFPSLALDTCFPTCHLKLNQQDKFHFYINTVTEWISWPLVPWVVLERSFVRQCIKCTKKLWKCSHSGKGSLTAFSPFLRGFCTSVAKFTFREGGGTQRMFRQTLIIK